MINFMKNHYAIMEHVSVECCTTGNLTHSELSVHLQSVPFLMIIHSYLIAAFHLTSFFLVPLEITRTSELLNASSVSGTAASSRRHEQGGLKAMGEAATADTVSYRPCLEADLLQHTLK